MAQDIRNDCGRRAIRHFGRQGFKPRSRFFMMTAGCQRGGGAMAGRRAEALVLHRQGLFKGRVGINVDEAHAGLIFARFQRLNLLRHPAGRGEGEESQDKAGEGCLRARHHGLKVGGLKRQRKPYGEFLERQCPPP